MNYFCRADSDPNHIISAKPGFIKAQMPNQTGKASLKTKTKPK